MTDAEQFGRRTNVTQRKCLRHQQTDHVSGTIDNRRTRGIPGISMDRKCLQVPCGKGGCQQECSTIALLQLFAGTCSASVSVLGIELKMGATTLLPTTIGPKRDSALTTTAIPVKIQPPSHSKRPTIIIYQKISPETVVVPIVSSIIGFPILALLVICCLRKRAKLARERARRRNCGAGSIGLSLVQLGAGRAARYPSFARPGRERPSLDLATVLEERSDAEQTQTELMTPDREERIQLGKLLSQPARYFLDGNR